MKRKHTGLLIVSLAVYGFLFVPLFIVAATSVTSASYVSFPPVGFSLKWYGKVFASRSFMQSLWLSTRISLYATLIALIAGIPGAYTLSRCEFPGKRLLKNFFFAPNIIPQIVMGFSLFQFIILKLRLPVTVSLLVGLTVAISTYILRGVGSSIESLDYAIEEAAMSLGLNRVQTFFKVVLPNITSGILSAFLLAFISAFNNVPVTIFLSGPGVVTLPVTMMNYMEYNYDPAVSALSVMLMIMSLAIMLISERLLHISGAAGMEE
ncbi:MAG: ABC transporter permease [Spirochaetaceae bacterium]|jgi:putative spermidine/putrescine transport system permease protein|nr:ABC transporter permease [Spirochaetaceae bacterium]